MECVYMGPKVNLCKFEISNWHEFLFRLHEDFIAPSLWNNYFWFWDDSFRGEKDYEVIIKSTSFVTIFLKFKEHLFFNCFGTVKDFEVVTKSTSSVKPFGKFKEHLFFGSFGVCNYCIDSVTSLTFYLNSKLSPCLHVHFVADMCLIVHLKFLMFTWKNHTVLKFYFFR